jgi:iron-sulfur cluster assembly accessory protein
MSETSELLGIGTTQITLTDAAAERIRALMQEKALDNHALRVFISGGGCSGYQYGMSFDNNPRQDDVKITYQDIEVIIDPISFGYLAGSKIDYVEDLMGGGFHIDNPNAVSTCGCGHSFRTEGKPASTESHSGGTCGCH